MKTRKELTDEYKQQKFKGGVFQIRNKINGKVFIDSSLNMDALWNRHRVELHFGNHRNIEMQKDWKEFGEENFNYEILSEIDQKDPNADYGKELKLLTSMFIEDIQPFNERGYNIYPKV